MRAWRRKLMAIPASLRATLQLWRQLSRGEKTGPEVLAELDELEARRGLRDR